MSDLKLIALDAEDLDIFSAHLQDAVVKVGDMAFLPSDRRFAAIFNRFDWLAAAPKGRGRARNERRRTALRLERVSSARLLAIDVAAKDRVLSLLAVRFEPREAPAGTVTLLFAGGAAIRLEVDCVEAELRDLGAVWAARMRPDHGDAGKGEPS